MKNLILAIKKEDGSMVLCKDDKSAKNLTKANKKWKFMEIKATASVMKALPDRANLVKI